MNTVPSDKSVILITLMRMTDSCACECRRNRGFSHRYRFKRQTTFSEEYRTLPQERPPRQVSPDTVPADKSIPYSPTKNTVLSHKFAPRLGADLPGSDSSFDKSPANAAIVPRKCTWRVIPYSPTRNTVLSHKEYRTLQQGIAYSPTNGVRDVPAKAGKSVGGRFVRPVCVYCLMFLCCLLGMGIKRLAEGGVQDLRLFEFEGGPLIQVEVNLEEAPLFVFRRRDRHEEDSTEARNTILTKDGDRLEQYWRITAHRDF